MEHVLGELDLLQHVSERVGHLLRTQVGVTRNFIEDLSQGHELDERDYRDGKEAIRNIIKILDAIKEFAQKIHFKPDRISLEELLSDFARDYSLSSICFNSKHNVQSPAALAVDVDRVLFLRALPFLFEFFLSKERWGVELPVAVSIKTHRELSFQFQSKAELPILAKDLIQIAKNDHSKESLGLMYFAKILDLHGANSSVKNLSAQILEIVIKF